MDPAHQKILRVHHADLGILYLEGFVICDDGKGRLDLAQPILGYEANLLRLP